MKFRITLQNYVLVQTAGHLEHLREASSATVQIALQNRKYQLLKI